MHYSVKWNNRNAYLNLYISLSLKSITDIENNIYKKFIKVEFFPLFKIKFQIFLAHYFLFVFVFNLDRCVLICDLVVNNGI